MTNSTYIRSAQEVNVNFTTSLLATTTRTIYQHEVQKIILNVAQYTHQ
jgi:hypothetical protein